MSLKSLDCEIRKFSKYDPIDSYVHARIYIYIYIYIYIIVLMDDLYFLFGMVIPPLTNIIAFICGFNINYVSESLPGLYSYIV